MPAPVLLCELDATGSMGNPKRGGKYHVEVSWSHSWGGGRPQHWVRHRIHRCPSRCSYCPTVQQWWGRTIDGPRGSGTTREAGRCAIACSAGRSEESHPVVGSRESPHRDSRPGSCTSAGSYPRGQQLRYPLVSCWGPHRTAEGSSATPASGAEGASGIYLAARGCSPHPVRVLRPAYTQPPGSRVGRPRTWRTRADRTPGCSESAAGIGDGRRRVTFGVWRELHVASKGRCRARDTGEG